MTMQQRQATIRMYHVNISHSYPLQSIAISLRWSSALLHLHYKTAEFLIKDGGTSKRDPKKGTEIQLNVVNLFGIIL